MQIGIIGLGKMGFNLGLNLIDKGYGVVALDTNPEILKKAAEQNMQTADSLGGLCFQLKEQQIIWLMVPAGKIVDEIIDELLPILQPGAILIDGGNSFYKDSIRRHTLLETKGIFYLDCGTSGGTSGALKGACTMIGGDQRAYETLKKVFEDISVEGGSLYVGKSGSGHFVKMIHNGIEYGMMQSIAEGFEVLERSDFDFDFEKLAHLFNNGSVIRSWLMELTENAFSKDAKLSGIKGVMHSSGEGKWTLDTALEMGVPTPVIAMSVMMRYRSQMENTFSGKVVAALRNEFGGHAVEQAEDN
ncbi:MAG: decarboxylating 6-phosphogluconate dehydrogenase [Chitinophagaceae bacterium]|nr:decarboxylating 6-phosphogluconate dehydrogenase [Chitinophagaceae bacterium]